MRVWNQLTQLVFSWPVNAVAHPHEQSALSVLPDSSRRPVAAGAKPLTGRFIHLTDLHPDSYYRHGTAESRACHSKKKKKKQPHSEGVVARETDTAATTLGDDDDDTVEELDVDNDDEDDDGDSEEDEGEGRPTLAHKGGKKRKRRRRHRRAGYWGLPVRCASHPACQRQVADSESPWCGRRREQRLRLSVRARERDIRLARATLPRRGRLCRLDRRQCSSW